MNRFWLYLNFWTFFGLLDPSLWNKLRLNFRNYLRHHLSNFLFQNTVINLGLWNFGRWDFRGAFDFLKIWNRLLLKFKRLNFISNLLNLVIQLNLLGLIVEILINLFNENFHSLLSRFLKNFEIGFVSQGNLIILFV
jgi:hypothetical protein